jgi:ribose transport system ATP-binding protein
MAFAVEGLRKSYGGSEVLSGIDLAVRDGEIHALLGANGAGKSTLIKCLSGAAPPSAGRIVVDGRAFTSMQPQDAQAAGIAVVHQESSAALSLNVCDNIFLGHELRRGPFLRRAAQRAEARDWLQALGVAVSPDDDLSQLGNADLQVIEIIKALRTHPRVLILDEPTAALSEREAQVLGAHLQKLKAQDLPMLYVTHRLSEVFALADRVSVLRGGRIVLSGPTADFSPEQIVEAIVGNVVSRQRVIRPVPAGATEILTVDGLTAHQVGPLSFSVRAGEIMGVFGLVGAGRTELVETLFGAQRRAAGRVTLAGRDFAPRSVADAVARGAALVPSDRLRKSILPGLGGRDNMLISALRRIGRTGLRRRVNEARVFSRLAHRLDLRPCLPQQEARRFSGGNQQKLVIGRWLNGLCDLHLLMLDEPTQGVDVGARKDIYDALRDLSLGGKAAILVTSSEPEELMQIAHRVIVLADGAIAGILEGGAVTETAMIALSHASESRQRPADPAWLPDPDKEHRHD